MSNKKIINTGKRVIRKIYIINELFEEFEDNKNDYTDVKKKKK